jgi:hypothetical protein
MTITLDLQPEIETGLLAQATARGVSLADYVKEIVVREAHASPETAPRHTGQDSIDACGKVSSKPAPAMDMVELFAPLRGLNIDFERDRDPGRDIVL